MVGVESGGHGVCGRCWAWGKCTRRCAKERQRELRNWQSRGRVAWCDQNGLYWSTKQGHREFRLGCCLKESLTQSIVSVHRPPALLPPADTSAYSLNCCAFVARRPRVDVTGHGSHFRPPPPRSWRTRGRTPGATTHTSWGVNVVNVSATFAQPTFGAPREHGTAHAAEINLHQHHCPSDRVRMPSSLRLPFHVNLVERSLASLLLDLVAIPGPLVLSYAASQSLPPRTCIALASLSSNHIHPCVFIVSSCINQYA